MLPPSRSSKAPLHLCYSHGCSLGYAVQSEGRRSIKLCVQAGRRCEVHPAPASHPHHTLVWVWGA